MTASPDDPTAEAATARPERPGNARSPLPLPRRSRGPSAIAEAAAAAQGAAAPTSRSAPAGTDSEPVPHLSVAAAEFAALTAPASPTGALDAGEGRDRRGGPAVDRHAFDASRRTAVPATARSTRSRKALLAGAGLVGAVLIGVPFLVGGGSDGDGRPAASGTGADTLLDDGQGGKLPGSFGSASPSGGASAAQASGTAATPDSAGTVTAGASPASPTPSGTTKKGGAGAGSPATHHAPPGGSSNSAQGVLIRGEGSGRCVDVSGGGTADRTPLQIWDCTGTAQQRWRFASDGTVRALGKCMDVEGGSGTDGATVQLVDCNGTPAQRFRLGAAHDLVNVRADKCVDVRDQGADNGTRLQLWTCGGTPNQKWGTG